MPIIDPHAASSADLFAEYEQFVSTHPHGHMMQSPSWARVKNNWDADYVYLRGNDGSIAAAMSILSVSNDDGHSSFLYAPRGPVCDLNDLDLIAALVKEAEPAIERRHGFVLRMDPEVPYSHELEDALRSRSQWRLRTPQNVDAHAFSNPPMNMVADLSGQDAQTLLATFRSGVRYKIRKSLKAPVTTRSLHYSDPGFPQALDAFYSLTLVMAQRQGITHRPRDYFERLCAAFPTARLYLAEHEDGQALASAIVVSYNKKAFYAYAASSNERRTLLPSYQLNYVAMLDAIEDGMSEYDMGGVFSTDIEDGLYAFKRQFCSDHGLRTMIGEIDVVRDEAAYQRFIER
ncbi:MAG: peptidoglycan bridge formation glycyltransferase FemA/FemB family protein [Actinomycetaceae bacterium]|nr:peptidoglycan bridge formation glycyltransferase FemA/FemB family protein [Actinomycetaceae bacterium]MDY6083086.1 peptidoglycan bridge formation glycyltransferase FemA/FemB family protein [Actinomycetaceae bacterium]